MRRFYIENLIAHLNGKVFFVLIFLYQLLFIFQGLDFADGGFHVTFYRLIFKDPQSVEFNFMYYFTGIVGGFFNLIYPQIGWIGFRFIGVVVVTSTLAVAYIILRRYLVNVYLKIGIIFSVLLISFYPKELNYDNLSAFLFVLSVYFLDKGFQHKKSYYFFLFGLFIGLNLFTRVTNIICFGLLLTVFYGGYIYRYKIKEQLISFLYSSLGIVCASFGVIVFMLYFNHYNLFKSSLNFVLNMGLEQESGHNYLSVITFLLKKYYHGLISVTIFVMISFFVLIFFTKIRNYFNLLSSYKIFIYLLIALVSYYLASRELHWPINLLFFVVVCFITTLFILFSKSGKELKVLAFIGSLLVILYSLGSEEYVEMHVLCMILPVAVNYLYSFNGFTLKMNSINIQVYARDLNVIKEILFVVILIICLHHNYFYPHGDNRNRIEMTYSINSEKAGFIYTSKERSIVVNELLTESAKVIKEGDLVIAYDCMPAFYYLTNTRPYLHNSWASSYLKQDFKEQLNRAWSKTKYCPVIIIQKESSLNGKWPTPDVNYLNKHESKELNIILHEFMLIHSYRKYWENQEFQIFVSDLKNYQKI